MASNDPQRTVVNRTNPNLGFFVYNTVAGRAQAPTSAERESLQTQDSPEDSAPAPQPVGLTAFLHLRAIAKQQWQRQQQQQKQLPKHNPYVGFFNHACVHRLDPLRQYLSDCTEESSAKVHKPRRQRLTTDDMSDSDSSMGSWMDDDVD